MTNEQALNVLKQILDAAAKGGLFENIDATFLATKAYNTIADTILKSEKVEDGHSVIS